MSLMKNNPVLADCVRGDIALDLDTPERSYQEIVCIEAELSGYHRSCLRVSIDFDRKIVSWKDSHQWNNNFLRSISPERMKNLRSMLPATHLLQWTTHITGPVSLDDDIICHSADWTVAISFRQSPSVRIMGSGQYPQEWQVFRDLIEFITKIPFRLR